MTFSINFIIMKRYRRNAISYSEIDEYIDSKNNKIKVGDYIYYKDNKLGPITKILYEMGLPDDSPIKCLIYINFKAYPYKEITKVV